MQSGHISFPNGLGLDFPGVNGEIVTAGVAPNELTRSEDREWIAGTPWHKSMPARVEGIVSAGAHDAPPRDSVALVVGAGDFIGAAIAKRFAAGGYVAAVGRRKADKLAPLVSEIGARGGRARAFAVDAREEENVQAVFATIERELGPLEVVVFNVGANVSFRLVETTSRVFRKVWEMACLGGFLTGREPPG
jgi:hypothetical protein